MSKNSFSTPRFIELFHLKFFQPEAILILACSKSQIKNRKVLGPRGNPSGHAPRAFQFLFFRGNVVEGYFLIHRKVLKGDIGKNPMTYFIFSHLLARANFADTTIDWFGESRVLSRGGLVFSYRELSKTLGISSNTLKKHIDALCKRKTIKIESAPEGSLIFFYNFSQYQDPSLASQPMTRVSSTDTDASQPVRRSVSTSETEVSQPLTPHNEAKNELKNIKRRAASSSPPTVRPESVAHLLQILGESYCQELAMTFPDNRYLERETRKLFLWFKDQPKKNLKTPAGWRRCVTSWMSRGWDSHTNRQPKEQSQRVFSV